MPNRSVVDIMLMSAYVAEATIANPTTLTGVDNQGADAVTHIVAVKTGAASAVATLYDSDDNVTYTAVDPLYIKTQATSDLDLSTAGVKLIGYVGPKRYSAVRVSGGTPVGSTFAIRSLLSRTVVAGTL